MFYGEGSASHSTETNSILKKIFQVAQRPPAVHIELEFKKSYYSIKEILSVGVCNMVFLHHLPSQMLIKEQPAQEVDQMRNPKEKDLVKVLSFPLQYY